MGHTAIVSNGGLSHIALNRILIKNSICLLYNHFHRKILTSDSSYIAFNDCKKEHIPSGTAIIIRIHGH